MKYKYLLVILSFFCCFNSLYAQFQGPVYIPNSSIKVYAYGNEKTLAWCGGFNNPQIQTADLNNDGLQDLVVYERYMGVRTFLNTGTPGNPIYVYSPAYALNFPFIDNYMILRDYNCDNIMDLFFQNQTGFAVCKGYYNAQNQLCFTYYENLFYNNDTRTNGSANAYNNITDIPSIVDVDNDGDLDFLSYDVVGGNINFYKNMRVERGLPCDSIVIALKDNCWGRVYQAYYRTHQLQFICDESTLHKDSKVTHQGNTVCLFDYDGDGDYDYLDGSISFNEMTFLKNGRIPYNPTGADSMVYQDTLWQSNGTVIELPLWPAAFNIDVDQDGKKDLLIAPNAANASENYKCIWYYKNETTPGNPSWVFQTDTFLVDKSIDMGTAAYPTLFDYNKDGKPDLFIGSDGFYQSSGTLKSRVAYYLNTSTTGAPSFTLQSNDFLNISNYDFQGAALAMGDVNNDGKQDMVIGHTDGTLSLLTNSAASDAVQPSWTFAQQALKDITNNIITVGKNAAPFIYDINKDGKPDLLIGSFAGGITYYENVSTIPGVVSLKYITDTLGGAFADPDMGFGGTSTPFIGKVDNTGKDYLLLGSSSGKIYRFDGFQNGNVTTDYTRLDSIYSNINNKNYITLRSAPTVADIDGDGRYEMLIGMVYGGVQLYKQDLLVGVTNVNANNDIHVVVYPNPASTNITVGLDALLTKNALIHIVNMEGQELMTTTAAAGLSNINISLTGMPSGIYMCILDAGDHKYYSKFTILK